MVSQRAHTSASASGGGSASHATGAADAASASVMHVRVPFNGRAVTRFVHGCGGGGGGERGGGERDEFCPLDVLARTVETLGAEFTRVCGAGAAAGAGAPAATD